MAGKIHTLGLSGFDRDEEAAFRELFARTAVRGWTLAPEAEAEALLIDIDSMYGQMGWLRAQNGPRKVAVLTMASRADTDYVLHRPVTAESLTALLQQLAGGSSDAAAPAEKVAPVAASAPAAAPQAAQPTPAAEPGSDTRSPAAANASAATSSTQSAASAAPPTAAAPTPATPTAHPLLHYLDPDVVAGPVRLKNAEPPLAFDPHAFTYAGGLALKPLAEHCRQPIAADAWQPLSVAEYEQLKISLGGTQPLSRLRWLAGLYRQPGQLAPELAGATRFKLGKWPQSEREFPKHFRIATALLKQPGSIEELAAASGASSADVADFINACHAIGIIEADGATPAVPNESAARGSLMSRLRGKP